MKSVPASRKPWYYVSELTQEQKTLLRDLPGATFDSSKNAFLVGVDILEGLLLDEPGDQLSKALLDYPGLYSYQQDPAKRMEIAHRRFLLFDMGLGKTPTTLSVLTRTRPGYTLIVCPSVVKQVWVDHISNWWPDAPEIHIVATEADAEDTPEHSQVCITSFNLLQHIPVRKWDAVVVDEAHYFKNKNSFRSKAIKKHIARAKPRNVYFLTGTPIDNEPGDMWNQVNTMFPRLWGDIWAFKRRYCNWKENKFAYSGRTYYGINPERAPELRARFNAISDRVTKQEVTHLLPPLTITPVRVQTKRDDVRSLLKEFSRTDRHATRVPSSLSHRCQSAKVRAAKDLVKEARASGAKRIVVATYSVKLANKIAKEIKAVAITGEDSISKRHEKITQAIASSPSTLVISINSLTTGVSLPSIEKVIMVELDHRPSTNTQFLSRFHRINGIVPVSVDMLLLEGTIEETIAQETKRKLEDQISLLTPGTAEAALLGAFEDNESDEEFFVALREQANSMLEGDPYL